MSQEIKWIKQSMTFNKNNKIAINNYCCVANISRLKFYNFFGSGLTGFFGYVLERQIKSSFSKHNHISKIIDSSLDEIAEYSDVYLQMFEQTTCAQHNEIRKKVRKALFEALKEYCFNKKGISSTVLDSVVENIYNDLFAWIVRGCEYDKNEVYRAIKVHFPILHGHRCDD